MATTSVRPVSGKSLWDRWKSDSLSRWLAVSSLHCMCCALLFLPLCLSVLFERKLSISGKLSPSLSPPPSLPPYPSLPPFLPPSLSPAPSPAAVSIVRQPVSWVVREGGSFKMRCRAEVVPNQPLLYQWVKNSTPIPNETAPELIRYEQNHTSVTLFPGSNLFMCNCSAPVVRVLMSIAFS